MSCPFPLSVDFTNEETANAIPGTGCAFPCFGTMTSQTQLDTYNTLETALSGLSTFCSLFLVLTWGLFAVKRKQKITFWISLCSLIISASIFLPALIKGTPEDVWCKSDIEGFSQEDGLSLCVVQGVVLIYFGLALCFWWWFSCLDLFFKLYRKMRNIQHFLKYYHLVSWGIPLIFTIILLSTQNYGFEQPRLWCFLDAESPTEFEFIFFYGWVGLLWFTGTVMMFLVFYSIFAQSRRYNSTGAKTKFWSRMKLYRTPVTFVLLFSFFWAVFFSFRLITVIDEDAYEDDATRWITCLLTGLATFAALGVAGTPHDTTFPGIGALEGYEEGDVCGETQIGGIGQGLLITAMITISIQGVLMFLVFGPTKENYNLWKGFLCGSRGRNTSKPYGSAEPYGSAGPGVAPVALKKENTFMEIARMVVSIFTCGRGKLWRSHEGINRSNNQPRLLFDKPDDMNTPYNTNSYVPKYYMTNNMNPQAGNANAPFSQPQQGGTHNPSSQFPPGLVPFQGQQNQTFDQSQRQQGGPNQEPFPGGYAPGSPGSNWSDPYDDPLWGINVAF